MFDKVSFCENLFILPKITLLYGNTQIACDKIIDIREGDVVNMFKVTHALYHV